MISRVAVDHRIHVASGHTPKQVGLAEHLERFSTLPFRLRNDADPEALCFKHAANHRHAKTRVINIRIATDDDDVATVPAKHVHLKPRGGQKFGGAKASCPVLAVTGQRLGRAGKKGDVYWGVHGHNRVTG